MRLVRVKIEIILRCITEDLNNGKTYFMLGLEYLITQNYPLSHNIIYKCSMIPIKTPTGFWGHLTKEIKFTWKSTHKRRNGKILKIKSNAPGTVLLDMKTAFQS